jgi:predicted nucleic acid-binding protein
LNGIDSSILVYALDPTTAEHPKARDSLLSLRSWAINPTVAHEAYHTLVFKRRMSMGDAAAKLRALIGDRRSTFLNITKAVSLYSLDLASEFNMGGRDSLIVACYLRNGLEIMFTHDKELLRFGTRTLLGSGVLPGQPKSNLTSYSVH